MSNFNNWHTGKTYFLEDDKETKNATFFVYYSAKTDLRKIQDGG
jgi:hypothetical protein